MTQPANWLPQYQKNITSQQGEDGIIEKIFDILPEKNHWCVEFGAWDGKYMSNVWHLLTEKNWSGVLIEADARRHKQLMQTYEKHPQAICVNEFVSFTGDKTLDRILAQTPIPKNFDLLSIDIDGNDYHIWESLMIYAPKVLLIEFNPSIPPDIEFVQAKDFTVNQGSSLLSLYKLGKAKGYELIASTVFNAFFVQKAYYHLFQIADNHPKLMHQDRTYHTQILQFFDGTIGLHGCQKLLWHDLKIDPRQIQPLPRFLQKYPENFNLLQRLVLKLWRMIKG